jgi:hypothetical protein
LFLKHKWNDIRTNAFSIHVGPLWEINIDAQFIVDPYTLVVYYIFYLTKVDKSIMWEMQIILDKCKCDEIQTTVNPTSRSYMLIHPIMSFQFIKTCEKNNRAFFY